MGVGAGWGAMTAFSFLPMGRDIVAVYGGCSKGRLWWGTGRGKQDGDGWGWEGDDMDDVGSWAGDDCVPVDSVGVKLHRGCEDVGVAAMDGER